MALSINNLSSFWSHNKKQKEVMINKVGIIKNKNLSKDVRRHEIADLALALCNILLLKPLKMKN